MSANESNQLKSREAFVMKHQLQGIALILFGILLVLVKIVDPWIPIVEEIGLNIIFCSGIILGAIGAVLSFKKEN